MWYYRVWTLEKYKELNQRTKLNDLIEQGDSKVQARTIRLTNGRSIMNFIWTLMRFMPFLLPLLTAVTKSMISINLNIKQGIKTNNLVFAQNKLYGTYSSCELCPQQDFSFRLMCFISFSVGNLYFLTYKCCKQKYTSNSTKPCIYLLLNWIGHVLHMMKISKSKSW